MAGLEPLSLPPGGDPDPGHLLPDEDWREVVEQAERERERIERGEPPALPGEIDDAWRASLRPTLSPRELGRLSTGLLPLSGVVSAPNNGGRRGAAPTFGVLHSAETPLRAGFAASIANYTATRAGNSYHYMTDPAETWGVLSDELIAWHCGNGNRNSLGVEQAGYARFTRAEWLTGAGSAQMKRTAAIMRAARDRFGIGLFWMTDQQLRDAHARRIVGGWATHDQCRRVLAGTSHTDPGSGFPYDVQMLLATGSTTGDDEMLDDERHALFEVRDYTGAKGGFGSRTADTIGYRVKDIQTALTNALPVLLKGADVDEQALAVALAPLMAQPLVAAVVAELEGIDGLDAAEAEAAAERAVRRVLGGLDAQVAGA